ncbi:helix-turn-helix domain-containing protein [Sphingopyxis sp. JAI128]|uniref:helix-turn-helix domain-containing protein n=1 Tax=Sphingopyxis sp. JAI128 TaxID=2723066 RepID=UPI00160D2DFD|nr:helix-turn-helix domain-containing protein [Sphingopyxis sp. JAI128]MBB6424979.1 transcriptional regulator with XRE-family HTH domain [Sphingopyxis sp. JAI128]
MAASCASNAHSSSEICAFYAHDNVVHLSHYWGMDVRWFKDRKADRKVTDQNLADAMGIERSVVNKVVNGKVMLDAYKADKVAELLGATPEEVLYRAGVPISKPGSRWRPSEETVRLVLETGLRPLTAADVPPDDFQLLVRAVTKGLQLVATQPSMEDDPGFRKAVELTIANAIDDYTLSPAQSA